MEKIILLVALTLSGCSFFSGSRSTASADGTCVKLSSESGLNMQNVCVGEESYIEKTKTSGKIVEIDTSEMDDDKIETIIFLVKDKSGKKIRMTGQEIILNKKGLCLKARNESLCVGDKFHSLENGNRRLILGFSLSSVGNQYTNIFTSDFSDNIVRTEPSWETISSMVASKTGMIEDLASCRETVQLTTDSLLTKCAKKELIKKMDKVCDTFRRGNGRVIADIETKTIKSMCSKEYSMFGTSTKSCTATLSAKCEKTKSVEGWVLGPEIEDNDNDNDSDGGFY